MIGTVRQKSSHSSAGTSEIWEIEHYLHNFLVFYLQYAGEDDKELHCVLLTICREDGKELPCVLLTICRGRR